MPFDDATVPISGRVQQGDYEFLMSHPMGGKVTASEKLRGVLSFYRSYHESLRNYGDCIAELERLADPAIKGVREAERRHGLRSEVLDRCLRTLPQMLAEVVTAEVPADPDKQREYLLALEARLANELAALLESFLRLALTRSAPAYNPRLPRTKLRTAIELIELIEKTQQSEDTPHE